jgi:DHA1 family multidrug resistance protein-like MFS transporter
MRKSTFLGLEEWQLTLAVLFLVQLLTSTGFSLVFPFLPRYVEELGSVTGLSVEMMAGLVIGVQGLTMMFASPFWGAIADRYGRKLMIMRATFGGVLIMGAMGMVGNGEQLIILRGIQGFITGTVAANNALLASITPRHKMGFAMGTLQVGLWAGVALGPIIGGILADSFGFAMPFYFTAISLLIAGIMVYFLVHEDFVPVKRKAEEPKARMRDQWKRIVLADGVGLIYSVRFLTDVGRNILVPIAPLFVPLLMHSESDHLNLIVGMVTSVAYTASTFSAVYLGRLGDKIGHRKVMIASALVATLAYVPQAFVHNVWQLLFLQGIAGLALGGLIAAPSALLANFTQAGDEGAVYGLDNSIAAGARAAAPIIGSTVAMLAGYRGTFAASAILFALVWLAALSFLPKAKHPSVQLAPAGD